MLVITYIQILSSGLSLTYDEKGGNTYMIKRLAELIRNFPVQSIFITAVIIVLLALGVTQIFMATGNDTLVKTSSNVYQNNKMFEEEFGGESIIVLYESDYLLTPEHFAHMKGLENTLQSSDSLYSILSPVMLVEEITNKQAEKFQEGISEVIDGLETMGSKLIGIGKEMNENAQNNQGIEFPNQEGLEMPDLGNIELPEFDGIELPEFESPELPGLDNQQFPDLEEQFGDLNRGFSQLIDAQEHLGTGTQGLVDGYFQFSMKTSELAETLSDVAMLIEGNPEQAQQLIGMSEGLHELSKQMEEISTNTDQLPGIPIQTIKGLQNIQEKLGSQLQEQKQQQEEMKKAQQKIQEEIKEKLQQEQAKKETQMKQEIETRLTEQKQKQAQKQKEIEKNMLAQQNEKEKQMEKFQAEMLGTLDEQVENLSMLAEGLTEMGENLQNISENMDTIYSYIDIMTPGLPTKQETLDNIVYDDHELRSIFDEVIVDDHHMIMMIKFKGNTDDKEKSEVVGMINDYLDTNQIDSIETIVSGKPVLDMGIQSSMQENIQKMMGLALVIMVVVLFLVFKVRWRLLPLLTVLIAIIGTVGLMGWFQIPITMVSMAVFPILIGLGIDYAIQFQNRYSEEMVKEDLNE